MSLLMHFCAADPAVVEDVTSSTWHALLRDSSRVAAYVDFSLHLSPIDLDILVVQVCAALGAPATTLTDSLVGLVAGDGQSWAVEVVDPRLVNLVAGVPGSMIEPLASRWVAAVAQEHREANPGVNPEILGALRELVRICDVALQGELAVLHAWFF
jgi:hypothetical protein